MSKAENTFQILNSSYCYATWILLSITANLNSNFIKYKKKDFQHRKLKNNKADMCVLYNCWEGTKFILKLSRERNVGLTLR